MKRSNLTICKRLIGLVRPLAGFMVIAILMGVVGNLFATMIPVFACYALFEPLGLSSPFTFKQIVICLVTFALFRGVLRYLEQACNHYIAFKLLALIRDKVFIALRRLSPAKLDGKDKGNLISLITSDIELLEVFYAHTISPIFIAAIFALIMIIYIGHFHVLLGVVALIAYLMIGMALPMHTSKKMNGKGTKLREASGDLSTFVLDSLRGLTENIQYQMGEKRLASMNQKTRDLLKEEKELKDSTGKTSAISDVMVLIFDIIMLLCSSYLYTHQLVSLQGVLLSEVGLMSSFGPFLALSSLGNTLQNTFGAGNRVLDILDESPLIEEVEGKEEVSFGHVDIRDVDFSYEKELILQEFSLSIEPNQIIGIQGKSGSGKSTLLKLLMRFYDPSEGSIEISNTSLPNINTKNLRAMEAYMTQETYLFHDTIENNIRIASLDSSDEEIVEACKKASIHDFIMQLPQGYQTNVGELGDMLSGGEKQRIALARAFLHDSPFLLLDEPTSNLDNLNEAIILKTLLQQKEAKTILIVSHQQSSLKIADKIYRVDQGRMS